MKARFLHIYQPVDMRLSHFGLGEMIKKDKIKIAKGQYVLFINNRKNQFKIMCGDPKIIISYQSLRPIDPGVVQYIPHYINGTDFNMSKAMSARIDAYFKRKGIRKTE